MVIRIRSLPRTTLLVSVGVLLSSVSFYLMLPVLPLYLIHLDGGRANIGAAGVVLGASFLVSALTSPIWGALSDRFGPKPMMLRSAIGLTVIYALFPLCHNVVALICLRLVNGLVAGYLPAAFSLVSRTASAGNVGKTMSSLSVCRNAGALLGPALGGFAIAVWGFDAAFLTAAVSMAVAGLVVIPLRNQVDAPSTVRLSGRWRAMVPIGVPRPVRAPLLLTYLTVAGTSMLTLGMPLLLSEHDADGSRVAAEVGTLGSAAGLIALTLGLLWGTLADRLGYRPLLLGVLPTSAALIAVLGVTDRIWQTGTVYLAYAAVQCEVSTLLVLYLIAAGGAKQRGALMGFNNTALQFGSATGPVLASVVAQAAGVSATFWTAALLVASAAAIFLVTGRVPVQSAIEDAKELV
jgi:MFS transporter, DHA1 family, multidrug resistance protein